MTTLAQFIGRNIPLVSFLVLAMVGMLFVYWFFSPATDKTAQAIALNSNVAFSAPIYKSIPDDPVGQRLSQSPGPIRIGIVSGHLGSDSGAVCEDGLTEAEVNAAIAEIVVANLKSHGINADILAEFDDRLAHYQGTAVISIHADSCAFISNELTGYKIAGSTYSDSNQLFSCLNQAYQTKTNLKFHQNTVTQHMTNYHVFQRLPASVPAIIIEVGFLNLDRELLTTQKNIPAQGISDGILCYINQNRS